MNEPIHDLDGQPFGDFARAAAMRDLLTRETGNGYRVEQSGEGFVVIRHSPRAAEQIHNSDDSFPDDPAALERYDFRPSLRVSLPLHLPILLLGGVLILQPIAVLTTLLQAIEVRALPDFLDPAWLVGGLRLIGLGLLAPTVLSVFIPWLSHRYRVDDHGVGMVLGIFNRSSMEIGYGDIRSIGLRQGLIERLFDIGTLEFAAAGTDSVDVVFTGIARPAAIRDIIQARTRAARSRD